MNCKKEKGSLPVEQVLFLGAILVLFICLFILLSNLSNFFHYSDVFKTPEKVISPDIASTHFFSHVND